MVLSKEIGEALMEFKGQAHVMFSRISVYEYMIFLKKNIMYVIFVLDFSNAQNCEKNGYPKKCLFGKICFSSKNIGERIVRVAFFQKVRFAFQISKKKFSKKQVGLNTTLDNITTLQHYNVVML